MGIGKKIEKELKHEKRNQVTDPPDVSASLGKTSIPFGIIPIWKRKPKLILNNGDIKKEEDTFAFVQNGHFGKWQGRTEGRDKKSIECHNWNYTRFKINTHSMWHIFPYIFLLGTLHFRFSGIPLLVVQ